MPILPPTRIKAVTALRTVPRVAWQVLANRRTPVGELADLLFQDARPAPVIKDAALIPAREPFILVFNHYASEHVQAFWGPLLVASVVSDTRAAEPRQVRWVVANEWAYPSGFGHWVKEPLTRILFRRFSEIYGFVLVPPILTGHPTRGQGVEGVRHALALTRGPSPQLVGIAPEGHAGPGGTLKEPPPGAGLFLTLLSHDVIPFLPVGWWEDERPGLTIRFGELFRLERPRSRDRDAQDCAAAEQVMVAIGRLLPQRLWGAYARQIAAGVAK